jgi:hypothetical protein
LTLGEVSYTLQRIRPKLEVTVENVDRAAIAAGAAAGNVEKASRAWEAASKDQSQKIAQVTTAVSVAVKQFTTFVSKTDESVNSDFIPALTRVVDSGNASIISQNTALLQNQKNLSAAISGITDSTIHLQQVLTDADKTFASPAIPESLEHIAKTTDEMQGVASDAHKAADMAVQKEYEILHPPPVKFAVKLFEFFGGHAVDGVELAWYLKNWNK